MEEQQRHILELVASLKHGTSFSVQVYDSKDINNNTLSDNAREITDNQLKYKV
jgi:hypothetical protein